MDIKTKLFLIISAFFFVSINGMGSKIKNADVQLLDAARSNDYAGAIEAVEAGARIDLLAMHPEMQNFALSLINDRVDRYLEIRAYDMLQKINLVRKNQIRKNTELKIDLVDIVLEYADPCPKTLYELNNLSIEEIDKLIHAYKNLKNSKKKQHRCLIM